MYFRLIFLFLLLVNSATAQIQPKFGLRAGVNISGMAAQSEIGDSSQRLEKFKVSPKIAVAVSMHLPFSKRFGLGIEAAFTQRGATYEYESPTSYLKVPSSGMLFEGHRRRVGMNVINGYVEVPVLFLAEPIEDRLMFEFGPSIGFLVSSRALGALKYTDPDHPTQIVEYDIDYRFLKDTVGGVIGSGTRTGKVDGTTITVPSSIGAYYFAPEKKGTFYNIVDFGLNMGVSLYFTKGLRIGARGYVGLLDITNNKMDFDQRTLDTNKNFILRSDRDTNWGLQFFIGLQF